MEYVLILTLPLALLIYAILATVALDRQYRRAEVWKKRYEKERDGYEAGNINVLTIEETVVKGPTGPIMHMRRLKEATK